MLVHVSSIEYAINAMGEIFMESKKKICKFFLSACFTMKEDDTSKNYGSIMIPTARGVRNSLFCVSTPKEREDMSISLPYIGQAVHHYIFLMFLPSP